MSHRRSQHPEVESLEVKSLLSGVSGSHVHIHVHETVVATVPLAATHQIQLSGTAKGDYSARTIPDAGKFYTFTNGTGTISPLNPPGSKGTTDVLGNVALPGLLIMPVPTTGSPTTTPSPTPLLPVVFATGQLFLSTPRGSLTLTLSAPSSDNAQSLPPAFSYKITAASGDYKGDTGFGSVVITVKPVNPTAMAGSSAVILPGGQEHGTFTMSFVPLTPVPVTGAGA
jgi:hypothetical protein